jgi:hypothetical protein
MVCQAAYCLALAVAAPQAPQSEPEDLKPHERHTSGHVPFAPNLRTVGNNLIVQRSHAVGFSGRDEAVGDAYRQ